MKPKYCSLFLRSFASGAALLALGTTANARMFDNNSTTTGFGVADTSSYDWWGTNLWNSATDATANDGTAATTTWVSGNTAAFFVGAGAGTHYTVRLGATGATSTNFRDFALNVNVASNAALAGAAGNVTIGNTGDTGILTIQQNNSFGAQNGGTLTINNSINMNGQFSNFRGGNVVINGLVTGATGSRFTFANGMGLTGGTLTLANTANTYAGRLATDTIIGGYTLAVTKLADGGQNSSIGTSSENIGLGGGTLKFIGTGTQSTNLGINLTSSSTIDASGATSADTISISGAPTNASLNSTLTLAGTNTGTNTIGFDFSNLGSGTKALKKQGVGTWVLTGTNSYTGATTVTEGKLSVGSTGTINGTSGVTIGTASTAAATEFNYNSSTALSKTVSFATGSTGGKLSGSGTITNAVSITVGNTLAIGNSPGQMNFSNTLALAGTTIMEIDGTVGAGVTGGNDFANLTGIGAAGVLTYGGGMTLDIGTMFTNGTYSWNLFDMASETSTFSTISLADQYSGSLLDADLNGVWDLTSGGNTWQFTESTGVLGLTVVPEPSTVLLGSLGMLVLLRRRR